MNEQQIWAMYFLTVVGWQYHPGYTKRNSQQLTLEQSAEIADQMLVLTKERF